MTRARRIQWVDEARRRLRTGTGERALFPPATTRRRRSLRAKRRSYGAVALGIGTVRHEQVPEEFRCENERREDGDDKVVVAPTHDLSRGSDASTSTRWS
jgi:hypothetical protein